ncbi:MAG: peptidoglycan-binding domain-containing protein, partial [Planctomycetota bacterium]
MAESKKPSEGGKSFPLAARMLKSLGGSTRRPPKQVEKKKEVLHQLSDAARRWEQTTLGIAPEGYSLLDDVREYRCLRSGTAGNAVTALQRVLRKTGRIEVELSGTFDDATEQAVQAFQTTHNIEENGVVGYQTMLAFDRALGLEPRERIGAPEKEGEIPKTGNAFIDELVPGAIRARKATGLAASVL